MMDHLAFSTVDQAMVVTSVLAYLDPGTGSYALQILLASLFGGLFALKQSCSAVKTWLDSKGIGRRSGATSEPLRTVIHGQSTAEIH